MIKTLPAKRTISIPTLRIDQLYLALVLAFFAVYISLIPVAPEDFWWHLKIGEYIAKEGAIPTTNLFAWSLPTDQPYFYAAWLGEYLLYTLHRLGGLPLLIFTRTALALVTFWLAGVEAQRQSGSWRLAALLVGAGLGMTMNNLGLRPQIWSWLPFMLFFLLLSRYADARLNPRWLLVLPLTMVAWVNLHGAFPLGLALIGIFFMGEALRQKFWPGATRDLRRLAWLGGTGVLTLLATFANPRFVEIYLYVYRMTTHPANRNLVSEFRPPSPAGLANLIFYLSVMGLLLALAFSRTRPAPAKALLLAFFLWMSWSWQRYIIWFGLAALPLFAGIISEALGSLSIRPPVFKGRQNLLNTVLAAVFFLPAVLVQPWWVERLSLPKSYQQLILPGSTLGPLVSADTPVGAVEWLRAHPGGRQFNDGSYGSYLNYALPEQGVFVDPRVELYPYEHWQDYLDISNGIRAGEAIERYGIDRVLLDKIRQPELSLYLKTAPGWELEYEDGLSEIWRKE